MIKRPWPKCQVVYNLIVRQIDQLYIHEKSHARKFFEFWTGVTI